VHSVGLAVPASSPYPWPFDGAVAAGRTALVLVGVQGGLAALCAGADEALVAMATLTSAMRGWGATVVHTRHARSPALRRPTALPSFGEAGWELLGEPGDADVIIDAFGVDGFAGSPLALRLAGLDIDHLVICGLGLEGPVHSTMRSANDRGLECLLVTDACAAADANLADPAVRIIEMSGGIFGAVTTSDLVLASVGSSPLPTPGGSRLCSDR
jgi:nicotinamidase-related amidase